MVAVHFQTESHYPFSKTKVRSAVEDYLKKIIKSKSEVSVSVVGNRRMKALNNKYRQIDATCDVLSFPQFEISGQSVPFVEHPDKVLRLGDIVISYPQAISQATKENKLVDDKLIELVLHGLDHLLGKHHEE